MRYKEFCLMILLIVAWSCANPKTEISNDSSGNGLGLSHIHEELALKRYSFENSSVNNIKLKVDSLRNILTFPHLIFRFSETNCQDCVKQVAKALKENFQVNDKRILILGSYASNRRLKLYLRSLEIDHFKFYNIEDQVLNDYLDFDNIPYLFIVDDKLRLDNLFIPHYQLPTQTEKYLSIISARLK